MDEARNLTELSTFLSTGRWDPAWICGQPLYALPASLTCALAGPTPLGLRLASVLCGLLTLPAVYLFARSIASRRTAWLAAWLVAVSHWHVIFSRIGFRAILTPLAIALCGWALARAWQRPTWTRWLSFGALCGVSWHAYFAFWLLPPLAFAALAVVALKRPPLRSRVAVSLTVFLILAGSWMLMVYARTGALLSSRVTETNVFQQTPSPVPIAMNAARALWMFTHRGDAQPRHNVPGRPAWPLLLLPFLIAGMGRAVARPTPARLGLLALWVATLLPTIFSDACPHHLRALGNVVPTAILTADGLVAGAALLARRSRRLAATLLFAFVIAGASGIGAYTYFVAYARQPALRFAFQAKECELARFIHDRLPSDRPVVVLNMVYGRESVGALVRARSDVTFVAWPLGAPVPPQVRSAGRETVWAIPQPDLVRLNALLGAPSLLAYFGPADGAPDWHLVEYPRPH
ncbi:glycosyltransferase family 39 protein [bacterium]|nr:glycosyltransferase family 39 protein [bacterium]